MASVADVGAIGVLRTFYASPWTFQTGLPLNLRAAADLMASTIPEHMKQNVQNPSSATLLIRSMRLLAGLLLATASTAAPADPIAPPNGLFGGLPLDLAIKQVRGNGKRAYATFEDPDCPYCRQMAHETIGMSDVTIYTFLYPVLSARSMKTAKDIWCARDRAQAWSAWMIDDVAPKAAHCDAAALEKVVALGKRMNVRSLPTIILADGERISGAVSRMALELAINAPKVLAFQAELERKVK